MGAEPSTASTTTRTWGMSLLDETVSGEEVGQQRAAVPVVLDLLTRRPGGAPGGRQHRAAGGGQAHLPGVDAEVAVTVSALVSESRTISAVSPVTVSWPAKVNCGTASRSASRAGTTPMPASVEAIPVRTRSKPIRWMAAARTSDVANASEPCRASSRTWTAASPPIDSALRRASCAPSGPIVRYVSSQSPDSLTCSACSAACSSSSESRPGTLTRSTVPSAWKLRSPVRSGVNLTSTTIFGTGHHLGRSVVGRYC